MVRTLSMLSIASCLSGCVGGNSRQSYDDGLRTAIAAMQVALLADPRACIPAVPEPEPAEPAERTVWLEARARYLKCLLAASGNPKACAACESDTRMEGGR